MLAFVEATTPLRWRLVSGYPDYHPEHPGGKPGGGRSLEPELYSFYELGEWAAMVVDNGKPRPMRLSETPLGGGTGIIDPDVLADRRSRDERGLGQALAGGLLKGVLDHGCEPVIGARAMDLLVEDGRVIGVRFCRTHEDHDEEHLVRARRGVIIATGGFEWDEAMVKNFLRGPMTVAGDAPEQHG